MDNNEIKSEIMRRIENNDEFTFSSLHARLPKEGYIIADRLLQKLRKEGKIEFERKGRAVVWRKVID